MTDKNMALLDRPEKTVSFTGYRPAKLPQAGSAEVQRQLAQVLRQTIRRTYHQGYSIYLNGFMAGWDILAAEAVLAMREECPHIRCVCVAPFKKHFFAHAGWTPEWKARALRVSRQADLAFTLDEEYQRGTYYSRDRFLVNHASLIIAFYDGRPGGTKYTLDYAAKKGLRTINLALDDNCEKM